MGNAPSDEAGGHAPPSTKNKEEDNGSVASHIKLPHETMAQRMQAATSEPLNPNAAVLSSSFGSFRSEPFHDDHQGANNSNNNGMSRMPQQQQTQLQGPHSHLAQAHPEPDWSTTQHPPQASPRLSLVPSSPRPGTPVPALSPRSSGHLANPMTRIGGTPNSAVLPAHTQVPAILSDTDDRSAWTDMAAPDPHTLVTPPIRPSARRSDDQEVVRLQDTTTRSVSSYYDPDDEDSSGIVLKQHKHKAVPRAWSSSVDEEGTISDRYASVPPPVTTTGQGRRGSTELGRNNRHLHLSTSPPPPPPQRRRSPRHSQKKLLNSGEDDWDHGMEVLPTSKSGSSPTRLSSRSGSGILLKSNKTSSSSPALSVQFQLNESDHHHRSVNNNNNNTALSPQPEPPLGQPKSQRSSSLMDMFSSDKDESEGGQMTSRGHLYKQVEPHADLEMTPGTPGTPILPSLNTPHNDSDDRGLQRQPLQQEPEETPSRSVLSEPSPVMSVVQRAADVAVEMCATPRSLPEQAPSETEEEQPQPLNTQPEQSPSKPLAAPQQRPPQPHRNEVSLRELVIGIDPSPGTQSAPAAMMAPFESRDDERSPATAVTTTTRNTTTATSTPPLSVTDKIAALSLADTVDTVEDTHDDDDDDETKDVGTDTLTDAANSILADQEPEKEQQRFIQQNQEDDENSALRRRNQVAFFAETPEPVVECGEPVCGGGGEDPRLAEFFGSNNDTLDPKDVRVEEIRRYMQQLQPLSPSQPRQLPYYHPVQGQEEVRDEPEVARPVEPDGRKVGVGSAQDQTVEPQIGGEIYNEIHKTLSLTIQERLYCPPVDGALGNDEDYYSNNNAPGTFTDPGHPSTFTNGVEENEDEEFDMLFIQKYEEFFEEFLQHNPHLTSCNPELVENLRVAKLQKLLEAAMEAEHTLQAEVEHLKSSTKAHEYHAQLLEASQQKSVQEAKLQQELHEMQQANRVAEGQLTWECTIVQCHNRAKAQQKILKDLFDQQFLDPNDMLSMLPKGTATESIREAVATIPVSAIPIDEEVLRQFQVDNAFLNAEVQLLETKLAELETQARKHSWVDSLFLRMNEQQLEKLRSEYQQKTLCVSF